MRNLFIILLVAMILGLIMPMSNMYLNSQQAFTPDNLVRMNLVFR
ncbi:MAG TPA: hypothetical protein VN426_17120 [Syntrophomonadaceae bacterium]|nr:hypothetical protein [Syntrophomonadaceae bacterium]